MARLKVSPMQDAFVMEDAVAQVADVEPPFVESRLVLLGCRGIWKRAFCKKGSDACPGM
jgi:hypothetical protein